jgi:hypothetical protein
MQCFIILLMEFNGGNFNWKHMNFAAEVRNIRFRLSTDGMNHFGEIDNSHSTWPVTLCI